MGIFGDWIRGMSAVSTQRDFDDLCRAVVSGTAHADAEHELRAMAKRLGIRPEKRKDRSR